MASIIRGGKQNNLTINLHCLSFIWCMRLKNKKFIPLNVKTTNKSGYITIPLNPASIYNTLNKNISYIINKKDLSKNNNSYRSKLCTKFIKNCSLWTFKKIKYHGKGYKIRKSTKLKKLTCRFGRSHWTKVKYNINKISIRRTKKNTFTILSIKKKNYLKLWDIVRCIKGVSKYTKRGIRLVRQKLKRRYGKVSQANSVYK